MYNVQVVCPLDAKRTFSQAGVEWVESRISVKDVTLGLDALEIARASSSKRGTVVTIAIVQDASDVDSMNLKLAEEIFDSFTIE